MKTSLKLLAWILAYILVEPSPFAVAQTVDAPKPLQFDAQPSAQAKPSDKGQKPKSKIPSMPKEFVDQREKMKVEFNTWRKEDEALHIECEAPQTPVEQKACDKKFEESEKKYEKVREHTREMMRNLNVWRRKVRGLPPPEWWPDPKKTQNQQQPGQAGSATVGGSPVPAPLPKLDKPILPQSDKPLPAGTF